MSSIAYFSIMDGNPNFIKVAKAWVYSAQKNDVKNLFIYCLCLDTTEELKKELGNIQIRFLDLPPLSASRMARFGYIPEGKIAASLQLLEEFNSVVYCDLDAFFLKNPTCVLEKLLKSHDLLLSLALGAQCYPPEASLRREWVICTGCFGVNNTSSTKFFLSTMRGWLNNGGGPTLEELRKAFPFRANRINKDLQSLVNFYFFYKEEWLPHYPPKGCRFQDNPSFTYGDLRFRLLSQEVVHRPPTKIHGTPLIRHVLSFPPTKNNSQARCNMKIKKFKLDFPDFS